MQNVEGPLPALMMPAAERFRGAMGELRAVRQAIAENQKKQAQVAKDTVAAKAAAITAQFRLEGLLLARYAETPSMVELVFPPAPTARRTVKPEEAQPAELKPADAKAADAKPSSGLPAGDPAPLAEEKPPESKAVA